MATRTDPKLVECFRQNLSTIRKFAGWSGAHLAELLDISNMTIYRLESTPNSMSVVQYLAIEKLFSDEILYGNDTLAFVRGYLVYYNDVPEKAKALFRDRVTAIAREVGRKPGAEVLKNKLIKSFNQGELYHEMP